MLILLYCSCLNDDQVIAEREDDDFPTDIVLSNMNLTNKNCVAVVAFIKGEIRLRRKRKAFN